MDFKKLWDQRKIGTYQDIELPDGTVLEGWRHSEKTWDQIKWIPFKNKIILDIGPFHAYFLIKAVQAGAKECYGIDLNVGALGEGEIKTLYVAKEIVKKWKFNNIYLIIADWMFSPIKNKVDIILCFNTAHYFHNINKGIEDMFKISKEWIIFQVMHHIVPIIYRYCNKYNFKVEKEIIGTWNQRPILFCRKV